MTARKAGWSCKNCSKDQARRVQHTLSSSTISALLLLPSSHQLTQERQPHTPSSTVTWVFFKGGAPELTIRTKEAYRTAAQGST